MEMRTKKLSMKEFKALKRVEGRIVDFYDVALLLTPKMVDMLDCDDWSYYHEINEELEYEFAALREEFGV